MSYELLVSIFFGVVLFTLTLVFFMLPWSRWARASSRWARASDDAVRSRSYVGNLQRQGHFSFLGRSKRLDYLITHLVIGFVYSVFLTLGLSLTSLEESLIVFLGFMIIAFSTVFAVWILCAVSARRARDCGISPWWALTLLIPPVNLAASVFLLFVPSDEFAGKGL